MSNWLNKEWIVCFWMDAIEFQIDKKNLRVRTKDLAMGPFFFLISLLDSFWKYGDGGMVVVFDEGVWLFKIIIKWRALKRTGKYWMVLSGMEKMKRLKWFIFIRSTFFFLGRLYLDIQNFFFFYCFWLGEWYIRCDTTYLPMGQFTCEMRPLTVGCLEFL